MLYVNIDPLLHYKLYLKTSSAGETSCYIGVKNHVMSHLLTMSLADYEHTFKTGIS